MYLVGLVCYFAPIAVSPALGVLRFNTPPLFLQTILVRLCRRLRHLPCTLQVKERLLPPPHPHPFPPILLFHIPQVHNWSNHSILGDRIIPSPNVGFHRIKPRLISLRLHQGVIPPSFQPLMLQPLRQSPLHLILETPQDPSYARE